MTTGTTINRKKLAAYFELVSRLPFLISIETDCTPTQWAALRFFADERNLRRTVTAFAASYMISQPAATQTIARLRQRGLLEQRQDPDDQRQKLFNATTAGLKLLREDPLNRIIEALAGFSEEQAQAFLDHLHQLARALEQHIDQWPPGPPKREGRLRRSGSQSPRKARRRAAG